jgi:hypothetical protein
MARSKTLTWVAISGSPVIGAKEIIYRPTRVEAGPTGPTAEGPIATQFVPTILRANRYIQSGEVSFEAYRESGESLCQIILNSDFERDLRRSGGIDDVLHNRWFSRWQVGANCLGWMGGSISRKSMGEGEGSYNRIDD